MEIQLNEKYRITSDPMNIILEERYEKRVGKGKDAPLSGEFDYRALGYFRDLESAGKWLANRELYKYEGSDLEKAAKRVEKLRDEIIEAMKGVKVK